MPIVKPGAETTPIKVSIPTDTLKKLEVYEKWASARRAKVIDTALQRLFKDDAEFIRHLEKGD